MRTEQEQQTAIALEGLRRSQAEFEAAAPLRPFIPYQNHYGFRQYVRSKDDLDGMIAYCFYKFQKIELQETHPGLSDDELAHASRHFLTGRCFEDNKKAARQKIDLLETLTIAKFVREKSRRDWVVGLCSGLAASVLAPFLFWLFVTVVQASGVTQPFALFAKGQALPAQSEISKTRHHG